MKLNEPGKHNTRQADNPKTGEALKVYSDLLQS